MTSATNAPRCHAAIPASFHEAFLARASGARGSRAKARALGGFLTLRLVDQFARLGTDSLNSEALAYQTKATADFIAQLYPRTAEVNHLAEIARVASGAARTGTNRTLWPPMLAFAYWLEQELRLDEALDALDTVLRLSDGRVAEEELATHLQRARALRRAGRFADASEGYANAGRLACELADHRSEMLSRIGRAIVHQKTGNLPESERILRSVLEDSRQLGDREAEARACHDLAVALATRERLDEAVPLAFRAYELYDHPSQRARALSDTGRLFKELGHYGSARDALTVVLVSSPETDILLRTKLEMLDVSAAMGDRLSFERWRRAIQTDYDLMPPDLQIDFAMKLGAGISTFGRDDEAEAKLREAVSLSEANGMGESLFRAEKLLAEIRDRAARRPRAAALATPPPVVQPTSELRSTMEAVGRLREKVEAPLAG